MYKIKPLPTTSRGSRNAKKKRLLSEKKEKESAIALEAKESKNQQSHKKMHDDVLAANKEIVTSIEGNTDALINSLLELKKQVAGIELASPEVDTSSIAKAVLSSDKNVVKAIDKLSKQIANIELDVQVKEVDLTEHTCLINNANKQYSESIKSVLQDLKKQIASIRLETDAPIDHWKLEWTERDNNGLAKRVDFIAVDKKVLN